jgi:hypothetical protein
MANSFIKNVLEYFNKFRDRLKTNFLADNKATLLSSGTGLIQSLTGSAWKSNITTPYSIRQ